MLGVQKHPIPKETVLDLIAQKPGFYTDCFATEIDSRITLSDYIEAFYTTPVFKVERLVLRCLGIRSSDQDACQLANGTADRFAAWRVADRTETQVLMKAIGRTSSWFMVEDLGQAGDQKTRLFFGTVIMPVPYDTDGVPRIGAFYSALLGFHVLYSKLLLASARRRLRRISG